MNNSDKVVLVVEDNAANMKLCHALLDAHGYMVLQATNGMEGLRMAREHRPDLILMDIQLPDISGLEVTKRLKEDETLKSIPVVAVTAFAMVGDEDRCRDSGCDGYLPKPISIPGLVQIVEHFLDRRVAQASATG
jgi:two-component system cell cycle response regulator DivK